uniref:Uncharacterized protein n=1 Tax=Mesocestoides corti TaxID=53468 RepID=A0A5K3FWW4_MESCO
MIRAHTHTPAKGVIYHPINPDTQAERPGWWWWGGVGCGGRGDTGIGQKARLQRERERERAKKKRRGGGNSVCASECSYLSKDTLNDDNDDALTFLPRTTFVQRVRSSDSCPIPPQRWSEPAMLLSPSMPFLSTLTRIMESTLS